MTDFLLFIDTEASGLPKKWDLPYFAKDNWPFSVQVAWVIYNKEGQEIKKENYFIKENDFTITRSAIKIHGITHTFLQANGFSRKEVMKKLSDDINEYKPLIVAHFMQFDYHMMSADFYRSNIANPVSKDMIFCTMLATAHLVKNPAQKYFRLGQLYQELFNIPLQNQHDALADANAAARCFYELVKRGEITDETIANQQKEIQKPYLENKGTGCIIPLLLIISLFFLIFLYL